MSIAKSLHGERIVHLCYFYHDDWYLDYCFGTRECHLFCSTATLLNVVAFFYELYPCVHPAHTSENRSIFNSAIILLSHLFCSTATLLNVVAFFYELYPCVHPAHKGRNLTEKHIPILGICFRTAHKVDTTPVSGLHLLSRKIKLFTINSRNIITLDKIICYDFSEKWKKSIDKIKRSTKD